MKLFSELFTNKILNIVLCFSFRIRLYLKKVIFLNNNSGLKFVLAEASDKIFVEKKVDKQRLMHLRLTISRSQARRNTWGKWGLVPTYINLMSIEKGLRLNIDLSPLDFEMLRRACSRPLDGLNSQLKSRRFVPSYFCYIR